MGAGLSVLYVDDDADIRTIVCLSLRLDPEIEVYATGSARDGLDMLTAGLRPDAIMLDVTMPQIDGPAMLATLRADPTTATIPVIFVTAKARRTDVDSYIALGAIGVVTKPFDPLGLATEVRKLLLGQLSPRHP